MGGDISFNNLTVSPPIVWIWSRSASPPNSLTLVCIWAELSIWNRGKKVFHFWWRSFFLVFIWIWGKKCSFLVTTFFFGLHLICSPEQNHGRGSSLPMLKIGQNLGKIANYLPQCSTKIGTPDEIVRSKTSFFKATHFSKSGNHSSDAIKSYSKILHHQQTFQIFSSAVQWWSIERLEQCGKN